MLNHARTLLMNVDGPGSSGTIGHELIPTEFKALNLPTYLDSLRAILFGASPDYAMRCYRCKQLLTMLHASPLVEFITALDRRITYNLTNTSLFASPSFTPKVTQISGVSTDELAISGDPAAPDASGRMFHSLTVEIVTDEVLRVTRATPPVQNVLFDLMIPSTWSEKFALVGSGYSGRVNTINTEASWLVEVYNRPQRSLGDLAEMFGSVGEPVLHSLFGVTQEEPYLTFRNLWFSHNELPMRLGGLVTAMIYRTNERR